MNASSTSTRDSSLARLAELLRAGRGPLIARWCQRVLDDPSVPEAKRLPMPLLQDHIPALIDRLASEMARRANESPEPESTGRALGQAEEATAHAHERFAEGYTMAAALRELSHFRGALMDFAASEGVPLEGNAALLLQSAIDEAMATVAVEIDSAARRELEIERRRLQRVLQLLPVGVFVADANGRIVERNDAAVAIWGDAPWLDSVAQYDQFVGWWASNGERVAAHEWGLARALATGELVRNEEVKIRAFDGAAKSILNSAAPIRDERGAVLGAVAVNVDFTERRRTEEQLREESVFRERVLGIVGHDLRSPLAAITFSARVLLQRESVPEPERRSLRRIATSADRMERMIRDLLDVTRVRQGMGIPVSRQRIDLREVCEQVIEEVGVAHADRRLELVVHGGCQGDWDPDRIAQVVTNLVVNALVHSPPGAAVRLEVGGADAHTVALAVHNEGPAIPTRVMATLFDPFKRGDAHAGSRSGGLGLGLYIAREIVRAHGGSIEVESTDAAGTVFTVRLPRDAQSTT